MPQLNSVPPFAKAKPHHNVKADFLKFTADVENKNLASLAYEYSQDLSNIAAQLEDPKQKVAALLAAARQKLVLHESEVAEKILKQAIDLDPENGELILQLAELYANDSSRWDESLQQYMRCVQLVPKSAYVYVGIASLLLRMRNTSLALEYFEVALTFDPNHTIALARALHLRGKQVKWDKQNELGKNLKQLAKSKVATDPFAHLALVDDGQYQRARSTHLVTSNTSNKVNLLSPYTDRAPGQKIRIGYFSNDFYDHATMHLMGGVLENHDHEEFEIYIYDYGSKKHDHEHERAKGCADVFRDIRGRSSADIKTLAREDKLDIAIDLKGFTQGTRYDIFAQRLAPLQIAYLGYPGTTGLKAMDYIIADEVVIPVSKRRHYSEKVLYMPHSYQPNDERRWIANIDSTRESLGLPETGFVFSSFNNPYKVTPKEFSIWMELLKEVEDSVLWIYTAGSDVIGNFRKEAQARGVDAERIIPAGKMLPEQHLARLRFADLFLDTFAVNAHTTASDALWSGLPVVTKLGDQFAARVAGSILTAAGLTDLVTTTASAYKAKALQMATDSTYYADVKARVMSSHDNSPLYDTRGYTRDFEDLLKQVFEAQHAGKKPAHQFLEDH